ncbi:MAG: carbohydrate ABC transporter permease [Chloroflexi bacterium]|nr:carbohydrate ABC transporter permease [Chloroflexota bacterium]
MLQETASRAPYVAARPASQRRARVRLARNALSYAILGLLSCVMALPLFWMLSTSLKTYRNVYAFPPQWIPNPVAWENYAEALSVVPFPLYFRNTMLIAVLVMAGNLVTCAVVAYGFARLNAPGKNLLFSILLSTMMLPGQVTLIPVYILFQRLGWVNTFAPLIVPSWFAHSAFSIFLFRQFFMSIPHELTDAAKIDGANHFVILSRIIVPLSKPVVATLGVFTFMGVWNDFFHPLIYLQDQSKFTLALGLLSLISAAREAGAGGEAWNLLMAGSAMVIAPMVVVFFFAQRYFIEGITLTGLKG